MADTPEINVGTHTEPGEGERARVAVHPRLLLAYRRARYVVETPAPVELRVGRASRELSDVLRNVRCDTAALLTAYNPASQVTDDHANRQAQRRLQHDLESLGVGCLAGFGEDADGCWPPEPSLLALGLSRAHADTLADKYGQSAYLWFGSEAAYCSLRLRQALLIPGDNEIMRWRETLPPAERDRAAGLNARDQAALMSVPDIERSHWLSPESWDLNMPWPLTLPEGGSIGVGTELDRMFKLIASGMVPTIESYSRIA